MMADRAFAFFTYNCYFGISFASFGPPRLQHSAHGMLEGPGRCLGDGTSQWNNGTMDVEGPFQIFDD